MPWQSLPSMTMPSPSPPSDVDVEQVVVLPVEPRHVGAVGHGLGVVLDEDPHPEPLAQDVGQRRIDRLLEIEGRGACSRAAVHAPRNVDVDAGDAFRSDAVERGDEPLDAAAHLVERVAGVLEPEIHVPFDPHGLPDEIHQSDVEFEGPHVHPHEAGAGFGPYAVAYGAASLGVQTDTVRLDDLPCGEHFGDVLGHGGQAESRGRGDFGDHERAVLHDVLHDAAADRSADAPFRRAEEVFFCHVSGVLLLQIYDLFGGKTNRMFEKSLSYPICLIIYPSL